SNRVVVEMPLRLIRINHLSEIPTNQQLRSKARSAWRRRHNQSRDTATHFKRHQMRQWHPSAIICSMYAPRNLPLALSLTVCCGSAARSAPEIQATAAQVQHINLRLDGPPRVGLPVWLYADLQSPLEARYPFAEDPGYFGSNRLELQRNAQLLDPHLPGI